MDNKLTFPNACIEEDVGRVSYLLSSQQVSPEILHKGLLHASKEGNTQILEILLDDGVTVNFCNSDGKFGLIAASSNGHTERVKLLLDHNVQVNLQNNKGQSALMIASRKGHTVTVKLLLYYNAYVDLLDNEGWSALMAASDAGHTETVKVLLDHNAQVDLQANEGWSALMAASQEGHTEIVKILLDHNAQVDLQDSDGMTALMAANDEGHTETIKLLLDAQMGLLDSEGALALELARRGGHTDIIQLLSAHGANTAPPQQGATPPDTQPGKDHTVQKTQEEMCDKQRNMKKTQEEMGDEQRHIKKEIQELKLPIEGFQIGQQPHPPATTSLHRVREDLKLSHLFQELLPLAAEWHNIGILLDLPPGLLDTIKRDFGQSRDCLREMLKAWLKTTAPPPTWERVVDAVKGFDQNKAEAFHNKYCTNTRVL